MRAAPAWAGRRSPVLPPGKVFWLGAELCRGLFNGFMRHTEALSHQLLGFLQVNRNQLADPLLRHRHTKQSVHTRHSHRMVGDDQKPRVRPAGHLIEQVAEPCDICII